MFLLGLLAVSVMWLDHITVVSRKETWIMTRIPSFHLGSSRFLKVVSTHGIHHVIQHGMVCRNQRSRRAPLAGECGH